MPVPGHRKTGDDWSPDAKLAVVIETAPLSETELSTYCREKGLHVEQVQRWKEACLLPCFGAWAQYACLKQLSSG